MRLRVLAAGLLLAAAPACTTERSEPVDTAMPTSITALGDSITRAFLACDETFGDCPEASWSTGTAADVDSHQQRIARAAGGRPVAAHNLAVSGARVAGLERQAARAVELRVEYVTVLIGANDACAPSERAMTPVADFAAAFDRALGTLARGLPEARILVSSIPDLLRLWEVGRNRPDVRAVWDRFSICQSMLADPTSTSTGARARRTRVRDRVRAYNDAMAGVCGKHPACRWDGNAVFGYEFSLDMVSPRDRWHPSRLGQRTLADVAWRAGFWPW